MVMLLLVLLQAAVPERMERALEHLRAGETEAARALLASIVEEDPEHGPARLQLGQLAVTRGEWQEAKRHLEVAVASSPHRLYLAWHLLGRAHVELGSLSDARRAFEEAIDRAPRFLPSRLALAAVAESEGDLYAALEQYRRAVELDAGNEAVWASLANAARRAGATDLARCAVERAGSSGSVAYLRAVIAEQAGDYDEAIRWTRRALELGYENASVYLTLGNVLHEKMDLSGAITAFEKAVAEDPEAAESLASFALTSLTTEEYERLRALLQPHVEAHPESLNTLYALGAMYSRDAELERAREIFERLAALLPESSQIQYNLAMVHLRRGDSEAGARALAHFRELRQREDAAWTRENEKHRIRVRVEELLGTDGGGEEAAALAARLVDSGGTAEDHALHGRALLRARRSEEALAAVEAGLAQDPYHRDLLRLGVEAAQDGATYRDRLGLLEGGCEP